MSEQLKVNKYPRTVHTGNTTKEMRQNTRKYRKGDIAVLWLCMAVRILSKSSDRNYILSRSLLDSTGTVSSDMINYFDGLGRPSQTVMKKASPGTVPKDIVTLQEYDGVGRPSHSYIPVPVTTTTGEYVAPATVKSASNSFYGDAHAYEKPVYEPSP